MLINIYMLEIQRLESGLDTQFISSYTQFSFYFSSPPVVETLQLLLSSPR